MSFTTVISSAIRGHRSLQAHTCSEPVLVAGTWDAGTLPSWGLIVLPGCSDWDQRVRYRCDATNSASLSTLDFVPAQASLHCAYR